MRKANVIRGRIEQHAKALGTVTPEMVEDRAREIALTNGRLADQFTQADLDQARAELQAAQHAPPEPAQDEDLDYSPQEDASVPPNHQAPTKLATDEQTLPEDLVREGAEEAAHEQMVAGNVESRRRDNQYGDHLP